MSDAETAPEYVYLSGEETLALFAEILGVPLDAARRELRDEGLLESALARPIHAAHYANADLAEQAATLLWGIAENQPFVDGNKRLGLVVTLTFLEVNGYVVDLSEDERVRLMFDVADGLDVRQVADRLRPLMRPFAE
ncbi:MAG: type II toxin-antitoxin system death-on-curing family toxin [Chloroflexi bacterium]|nr:type II toxin-antitoxin system death-on-curing family toxin [Chloroflexota bacterium]